MSHQRSGVRHRTAVLAGVALLAAGAFAPSASAETLFTGPDAPLVVQGDACVGPACVSGDPPSRTFVVRNQDTPIVRLDQTGGGFTPQIWDVAGNEANFFVRDTTAGSQLPFRIFPGAKTNSLTVRDGAVGIGTNVPAKGLDVVGDSGETTLKVTETSTTVEARTLADLTNRGPVAVRLSDSDANVGWTLATAADGTVALTPEGPSALPSLVLAPFGDVTAGGVVQQTVDPARQTGVRAAATTPIVEAIRTLPIERFGLAGDASGVEHLAPNGAAFRAAFGLGSSGERIAPGDVGTVALVGVQALLNDEATNDDLTGALAKRADGHEARIWAAEQVARGHEQRIRTLERQATLAESRFQRSNRAQRRLSTQVSSLRGQNARLERRLAAVEAAVAKLR